MRRTVRFIYRSLGAFLTLTIGVLISLAAGMIIWDHDQLRTFRTQWLYHLARPLLHFFGLRVETLQKNAPPFFNRGGVTISNHISYTDILAIASQTPSLFVTSTEMRDTLGLGWLCRLGGCEFVNRKNPGGLRQELARLTQLIQAGKHVVFFPEATSTRGNELKPFKAALFESVRESDAPLWILAIHYRPELVRSLSFAEDDSFLSHALQLFLLESSPMELHWLKKMEPEAIALQTARDLAKNSHRLIHEALFGRTDATNPSL